MQDEKQFKIIKSRGLAECLRYISQVNYYTYKSVESDNREVYSFIDNEQFQELLSDVIKLCEKHRNNQN